MIKDILILIAMTMFMVTSVLMFFTLVYTVRNCKCLNQPDDSAFISKKDKVLYIIISIFYLVSLIGGFVILNKMFV